jgi:hypothetical protein
MALVAEEKIVDTIKHLLGVRRVVSRHGTRELREPVLPFQDDFVSEICGLRVENLCYSDICYNNTIC